MSLLKWRIAFAALAALFGIATISNAYDESGIEVQADRIFIHKESKSALRAPLGWNIVAPYRLRRTTESTVLGLEKDEGRVSITVIWSPLGTSFFSEMIRPAADEKVIPAVNENLGDEYALLQTVYGKGKVSPPTTMKVGPYTVFKILIDDGPDIDDVVGKKSAGAVYLFEAGPRDNRWKVKVRAVYPQLEREKNMKDVDEVVSKFFMEQ